MAKKVSKKQRYSTAEKRAYWIGVGMSVANHGEESKFMQCNNAAVRKSVRAGYAADNSKDVSSKLCKSRKSKTAR